MGYKTEEEKRLNKDEQQYNVIGSEVLPQDNGYEFNEELKHDKNGEDNRVNLNMCSAYTHVFAADTLRSIAVVAASIISETVDSVTSEVADSSAAVIVSLIIMISLIPLFRGIISPWCELRSLHEEEQNIVSDKGNQEVRTS